jgi:hypothetical protein
LVPQSSALSASALDGRSSIAVFRPVNEAALEHGHEVALEVKLAFYVGVGVVMLLAGAIARSPLLLLGGVLVFVVGVAHHRLDR